MFAALPVLLAVVLAPPALAIDLQTLVSQYGTTSANFTFGMPDTTEDSQASANYIKRSWDLNGGIDWGSSDIVFSPDPSTNTSAAFVRRQALTFYTAQSSTSAAAGSSSTSGSASTAPTSKAQTSGTSSTSRSKSSGGGATSTQTSISYPASTALAGLPPALRVQYPAGSYSKRTGGTQFYAQPLVNLPYERMILSYDIWFPSGYSFVQGGKLPGMRGGADRSGCSGGSQTDGTTCFSTRLMWRANGAGEVYAYIPTTSTGLCSQSQVICNSDFGTSLGRGTFTFQTGVWQTIYLVVVLNKVGTANGIVELYYNGTKAMSFTNLVLRTASSIDSVGGMFFSTFFGGDDSSWATPTDQYVYWRNMQLWAGQGASNLSGNAVSSSGGKSAAQSRIQRPSLMSTGWLGGSAAALAITTLGAVTLGCGLF